MKRIILPVFLIILMLASSGVLRAQSRELWISGGESNLRFPYPSTNRNLGSTDPSGQPNDVDEVLAACKLTLLPGSYDELRATCTCPDAANPCKHLAAVYYILAERFDDSSCGDHAALQDLALVLAAPPAIPNARSG